MAKMYPFSVTKHAHDIEFYRNRLFNTMKDMESGEIKMDCDRYDRIYDMYYGPLEELYDAILSSRDGRVAMLTGTQIALAQKIVIWASETRAATCIANGKLRNLQYC